MFIKKEFIYRTSIILLSVAGTAVLLGCNSQKDKSSPAVNEEETIESKNQSDNDASLADLGNTERKLLIDKNRCIGCGKCARVAPENFKMSGRKAIIVSEEKSGATTQAIKVCPVNAISA